MICFNPTVGLLVRASSTDYINIWMTGLLSVAKARAPLTSQGDLTENALGNYRQFKLPSC